jgi:hypothetical protein
MGARWLGSPAGEGAVIIIIITTTTIIIIIAIDNSHE